MIIAFGMPLGFVLTGGEAPEINSAADLVGIDMSDCLIALIIVNSDLFGSRVIPLRW